MENLNLWSSALEFLEFDFLLYALIGTFFLSLITSIVSPLIISRGNAFLGTAISHSTLLGLALSMSFISKENDLGIFFSTLIITVILTSFLAREDKSKLPDDSKLGIFYTSTMALGILIYSSNPSNKSDLINFLFGNILLLSKTDLWIIFFVFILVVLFIVIPIKKWILTTVDPIGSEARGLNPKLFSLAFFALMTVVIVTSIKLAGTILIETMLLTPGFFAMNFAKSIKQTFIYSITYSILCCLVGLFLANLFSLPSGATIAVVQFVILVFSLTLKLLYQKFGVSFKVYK